MKIKSVKIKNEKVLNSLDISFLDDSGKILDTIVIAGANGSGKTTILRKIFESFQKSNIKSNVEIKCFVDSSEETIIRDVFGYCAVNSELIVPNNEGWYWSDLKKTDLPEKFFPKIIYMPTEINFEEMKVEKKDFEYKYEFVNVINQTVIKDIPSFIATKINDEVYKNEELPAKTVIERVCGEINELFSEIDIDAKIIGVKKEGEKLPIFKNRNGAEFDINGLSSGEKQLFVRAMSLKLVNANNSIILIDEPEISLHPEWQQKIVKIYQSIGENNQIIIATHSPQIISTVKKESLKILYKENEGMKLLESNDIEGSYGYNVERVLTEIMGLKNIRNSDVEKELEYLRKMVTEGKYETEEFKEKYSSLVKKLGTLDQDIILLNLGIAQKKGEKNAQNR